MAYLPKGIASGLAWMNFNVTPLQTGSEINVIYGHLSTGSPHGHAVFRNGSEIFQRPIDNLTATISGATILIKCGS